MATLPENGLIHIRSRYSVPETLKRLESVLQAQGVKIFACIDHSGEAEKVGLKMHPAQPLIFGSGHERMLSKLHSTSPVCN